MSTSSHLDRTRPVPLTIVVSPSPVEKSPHIPRVPVGLALPLRFVLKIYRRLIQTRPASPMTDRPSDILKVRSLSTSVQLYR